MAIFYAFSQFFTLFRNFLRFVAIFYASSQFFTLFRRFQQLWFIQIPGENNAHVTSLSVSSDTFAVHIGTSDSQFLSYDMSSLLNFDTEVERKTFLLDIQPKLHFTFESCKDRLQRESVRQKAEEIRQSEIDRKKKQLKAKKDAGEEFSQEQEDEFLKVAIVEIDESPFFVPKTPGKILSVWSVNGDDTEFCMSLSGYDAGLLYQVNGRTGKVLNFQNLGLECEVTKVHRTDDNLVYFGFSDGSIRIYSGEGLQGGFTKMSHLEGRKTSFQVKNPVFGLKSPFFGQKPSFYVKKRSF